MDMRTWIDDLEKAGELIRIDKPVDGPGAALWQRLGSKVLIDATIPPPADAGARAMFERIRPRNRELRLEDFAAAASLPLVRALSRRFFDSKLLG